jgi:cytochrome c-type biogenesis protein CcmH/NrfG
VLEAEPENAKALRGLGFCYIHSSNYEAAVRAYEKAAKAEPGNADAWAGLGNAHLGLQDWGAAEHAFGRARAIDPANATLRRGSELLERAKAAQH